MMPMRSIVAGLLTLAVCAPAVLSASDRYAKVHPQKLLAKIQKANSELSFTGTYVFDHGEGLSTARVIQKAAPTGVQLRVEMLDGEPREIIRLSDSVKTYLPKEKVVKVSRDPVARPDFPRVFYGTPDEVLRHYRVKITDGGRVAGQPADLIELQPVDGYRWGVRCWVDRKNSLVLKHQQIDPSGEPKGEFAFTEIEFHRKPPVIKSRYEGQTGWKERSNGLKPVELSKLGQLPTLNGFRPLAAMQSADGKTRQILFGDGLVVVSVFQEYGSGQPAHKPATSLAGMSIAAKQHSGWLVSAVGEVPPTTVMALADKVLPSPLP
ncbi:MAG: hypothetical protein RL617_461 [Pseudomonadota bacterium]|jgi:sigma-E factor negative regulatory protein RseB